jgi:hypothetical protein
MTQCYMSYIMFLLWKCSFTCAIIDIVMRLLQHLPRSELADIHRKIGPLLLVDIVGVRKLDFTVFSRVMG